MARNSRALAATNHPRNRQNIEENKPKARARGREKQVTAGDARGAAELARTMIAATETQRHTRRERARNESSSLAGPQGKELQEKIHRSSDAKTRRTNTQWASVTESRLGAIATMDVRERWAEPPISSRG